MNKKRSVQPLQTNNTNNEEDLISANLVNPSGQKLLKTRDIRQLFMNLAGFKILNVTLPLIIGGAIYLLFRAKTLLMFSWFEPIVTSSSFMDLRNFVNTFKYLIPDIILFSLPDALWIYSLLMAYIYIWNSTLNRQNLFWFLLAPGISFFSEIGQALALVTGTFDSDDLLLSILFTLAASIQIRHIDFHSGEML